MLEMQNKHEATVWNTLIDPRDQFHGYVEWLQELTMTKLCTEEKQLRNVNEVLFNISKSLYNVEAVTERSSLEKDAPKYRSCKVWLLIILVKFF